MMSELNKEAFEELAVKGTWKYGTVPFDYNSKDGPGNQVVYVIIDTSSDDKRYFTNRVTSKAAFDELTIHKATFNTLSKNFTGRNQIDMYTYLVKNNVKKVA